MATMKEDGSDFHAAANEFIMAVYNTTLFGKFLRAILDKLSQIL